LRMFEAVARHLSFTRAAEELCVAQPWLSVQLRRLEEQLGFALFARGRKRAVVLTDEGEALLPHARALAASHQRLCAEASRIRKGQRRRLVLGAPEFSADIAARQQLLAALRARGDIEVEIVNGPSTALIDHLRQGRVDITLALGPLPAEADLEACVLAQTGLWLALPDGHPLAAMAAVPMALLAGQRIANFRRRLNPQVYDHMARLFAEAGVEVEHLPEASARAVMLFVAQEQTPVIVTQWMAPLLAGSQVVLRPVADAPLRLQLLLLRRRGDARAGVAALWACAEALEEGV
ncbi:MAG TPA: LysR family transcriptional regulator, partial [Novosphingobium sp.]|nr:LysR family transcriptional regulator [Novosphingobium sp.]